MYSGILALLVFLGFIENQFYGFAVERARNQADRVIGDPLVAFLDAREEVRRDLFREASRGGDLGGLHGVDQAFRGPAPLVPQAPDGVSLPLSEPLTRVLLASCNDEEKASPTLSTLAGEEADLGWLKNNLEAKYSIKSKILGDKKRQYGEV